MPELPEAETIARQLDQAIKGRMLDRVILRRRDIVHGDPRPLSKILPGRRVVRVWRRAKRVVIDLEPKAQLIFHLGMSGRLTVNVASEPIAPHTHLRIAFTKLKKELRFCDPRRFGGVWCITDHPQHVGKKLGPLGFEPLDAKLGEYRKLFARRRQIKALLLDQKLIAGMGNIYCDESLHAARIHPVTLADQLDRDQVSKLVRAIRATLRRAIRHNGSTLMNYVSADGEAGSFQRLHRAYGREGKPCRTCGTPIEHITAAGRSTFLCVVCQPLLG